MGGEELSRVISVGLAGDAAKNLGIEIPSPPIPLLPTNPEQV